MRFSLILALGLCHLAWNSLSMAMSMTMSTTPAILDPTSSIPEDPDPNPSLDSKVQVHEVVQEATWLATHSLEESNENGTISTSTREEEERSNRCGINWEALKLPTGLEWKRSHGGSIPHRSVHAGYESGNPVYVARAIQKNSLVPGKLVRSHRGAFVPHYGEHFHKHYETLTVSNPNLVQLEWVRSGKSVPIPNDALIGGWDTKRCKPLYIGRSIGSYKSTQNLPGKINSWSRTFYLPYCGEKHFDSYDVLVERSADSYQLTQITYKIDPRRVSSAGSVYLTSLTADNCGQLEQVVTVSKQVTMRQEKSWTTSSTHKFGISVTVEKSYGLTVKKLFNLGGKLSVTGHYEGSYTTSFSRIESSSVTETVTTAVRVPDGHKMYATIMGSKANVDVPYTATLIEFRQGRELRRRRISGVLKNTLVFDWNVSWGRPMKC